MKKHIFSLVVLLLGTAAARAQGQPVLLDTIVIGAQGRLGIKLSPSLSLNRVHVSPNNARFSRAGAAFCFKLGVVYDHPIKDNCYVSTELLYATQHVAIKNGTSSPSIREKHVLHYLQVPVLLKLYTSELTLDTRLYVVLGVLGQIRIKARNIELQENQAKPFLEKFRRWGLAGLLGVGVEYDTSLSTSVFAGISYQHGFSSIIRKQVQSPSTFQVMGYGDLLSVDLGIRF